MRDLYMPGQSNNTYRVEHWVSSNLHAYSSDPFNFKVNEAEVTLFLPPQNQAADGFRAGTTLMASTVQEAENRAHNVLGKVLDVIAYKIKARAIIERPLRSQVAGTGSLRQCAVYWLG